MEDLIIGYENDSFSNCKKQQLVWVADPDRIYGIISQYESRTATKFSSASRRATDFGKADYRTVKHDVYWDKIYGETSIEFDGTPFMLVNEIKFACVHGPDQHKAKKLRAATDCSPSTAKKRRILLPDTKKLDCPAAIIVKETIRFPDYTINKNTKWRKEIMSKKLRNDLRIAADVKIDVRYYIILPAISDHQNHIVGQLSTQHQMMDPNFVKKLEVLVSEGVQSVDEVKLQLNRHLKELFPNGPLPSSKSKRFHPSKKSIKNRINIELSKVRSSLVHQDDLELLINDYKERKPVDFVYFRKHSSEALSGGSKFLLVCQTVDQKRLLQRYGSEICILDTTYKELKYGLPLCMIYVKTNVDYQPVGAFVTQDSTTESISEGLKILKEANSTRAAIQNITICLKEMISSSDKKVRIAKKEEMLMHLQKLYCIEEEMQCLVNSAVERIEGLRDVEAPEWDAELESVWLFLSILEGASWDWNPPFFIADLCKEEIQAIENVFQSQVYVSNHYRHQAWLTWLNAASLSPTEQHELLTKLHKVVSAKSTSDFETAVLELKGSNIWRQNLQFQRWFCSTWLGESRRWALAFRQNLFGCDYSMWAVALRHELFDSSSGSDVDNIGTLNNLLKAHYLQSYFVNGHLQLTLSELYFILMSQFFPDQYAKYTSLNARCLSEYSSYTSVIPDFIQDRPHSFISHCADRILRAKEMHSITISEMRAGVFELHTESEGVNCVDFGNADILPSCTCVDWQQYKLPCKHFFQIFQQWTVSWCDLSSRYRNSPYFVLDNEVDINYEVVAVETVTNFEQPSTVLQDDVVIAVRNIAFTKGDIVEDALHDFHLVPVELLNSANEAATLSISDLGVHEQDVVFEEPECHLSGDVQGEDVSAVHELDLLTCDLVSQTAEHDYHSTPIELRSNGNGQDCENINSTQSTEVISGDVIIQDSGHDYHVICDNATEVTHEDISVARSLDCSAGDLVIHGSGHDYHVMPVASPDSNLDVNGEHDSEPSTVILRDTIYTQEKESFSDAVFQSSGFSEAEQVTVYIAQDDIETFQKNSNENQAGNQAYSYLLQKIERQLQQVSNGDILQEACRRLKQVEEFLNSSDATES